MGTRALPLLAAGALLLPAGCAADRRVERESAQAWRELRRAEARLQADRTASARHAREDRRARRARDRRAAPRVAAVIRRVNAAFLAGDVHTACASYSPPGQRDVAAWLRSGSCEEGMRRARSLTRRLLADARWRSLFLARPRVSVRGSRARVRMTPPPGSSGAIRFLVERSNEELVKRGGRWQIASFP
jgi:hypothetical protein